MNIKCVFWFYLQLLFEIFLILRIQQDMIKKCSIPYMYNTRYSCQPFKKLEFSR